MFIYLQSYDYSFDVKNLFCYSSISLSVGFIKQLIHINNTISMLLSLFAFKYPIHDVLSFSLLPPLPPPSSNPLALASSGCSDPFPPSYHPNHRAHLQHQIFYSIDNETFYIPIGYMHKGNRGCISEPEKMSMPSSLYLLDLPNNVFPLYLKLLWQALASCTQLFKEQGSATTYFGLKSFPTNNDYVVATKLNNHRGRSHIMMPPGNDKKAWVFFLSLVVDFFGGGIKSTPSSPTYYKETHGGHTSVYPPSLAPLLSLPALSKLRLVEKPSPF